MKLDLSIVENGKIRDLIKDIDYFFNPKPIDEPTISYGKELNQGIAIKAGRYHHNTVILKRYISRNGENLDNVKKFIYLMRKQLECPAFERGDVLKLAIDVQFYEKDWEWLHDAEFFLEDRMNRKDLK